MNEVEEVCAPVSSKQQQQQQHRPLVVLLWFISQKTVKQVIKRMLGGRGGVAYVARRHDGGLWNVWRRLNRLTVRRRP